MENIRNKKILEIEKVLENIGEKKFRAKQIYEWLWKKNVNNFSQMTNLSQSLIEKLQNNFFIDAVKLDFYISGKDKTTKCLFKTIDSHNFEGVIIPSADRVTACISTQIACPLACTFCATGKLNFIRNLTTGEIFDEVFILNDLSKKIFNKKLSNIVVMGMGEPLLNYENVISAINIITSKESLEISPQRITLSTAGIVPKIIQLADDNIKFELAISLHSADNEIRSTLMPINKKFNLEELSNALIYFYKKTQKRITYEYLLLNNINDSIEDAKKLVDFTKITPCKINILEYNSIETTVFSTSSKFKLQKFVNFLESKNLIVTVRKSKGDDISAACGQLAGKFLQHI